MNLFPIEAAACDNQKNVYPDLAWYLRDEDFTITDITSGFLDRHTRILAKLRQKVVQALIGVDSKLSREVLPVGSLLELGALSEEDAAEIALKRCIAKVCVYLDQAAFGIMLAGLNPGKMNLPLFLSALISRIGFQRLEMYLLNQAASDTGTAFARQERQYKPHLSLLHQLLADKIPDDKIALLTQQYDNLYTADTRSNSKLRMIWAPVIAIGSLVDRGRYLSAIILPLLAVYLYMQGPLTYVQSDRKRRLGFRVVASAEDKNGRKKLVDEHTAMTLKLGFKYDIGTFLFVLEFLLGMNFAQAFSSYIATTQGLAPFNAMLTQHREKVNAIEAVELISKLFSILKMHPLIFNQAMWDASRASKQDWPEVPRVPVSIQNGVIIEHTSGQTAVHAASPDTLPTTHIVESRTVKFLRERSGTGKSLSLQAIAGLIDSDTTRVYLVEDGKVQPSITIASLIEYRQRIFHPEIFIKDPNRSIVDICNELFLLDSRAIKLRNDLEKNGFTQSEIERILQCASDLLQEAMIANNSYALLHTEVSQERKAVLWKLVRTLLDERLRWADERFRSAGNLDLENIGSRKYSTLSRGQKARFLVKLCLEAARHFPIQLILLDEPFAGLDELKDEKSDAQTIVNFEEQLKDIGALLSLDYNGIAPALLMAEHSTSVNEVLIQKTSLIQRVVQFVPHSEERNRLIDLISQSNDPRGDLLFELREEVLTNLRRPNQRTFRRYFPNPMGLSSFDISVFNNERITWYKQILQPTNEEFQAFSDSVMSVFPSALYTNLSATTQTMNEFERDPDAVRDAAIALGLSILELDYLLSAELGAHRMSGIFECTDD